MGKRSNGEGTIYKRQDGQWCAQVSYEYDGKRKRKSFYGKTQKEAKEKAKEFSEKKIQQEVEGNRLTEDLRLGEWMVRWLREFKRSTVKETTYQGYWMVFNSHVKDAEIAKIPLNDLTVEGLQKFYRDLSTEGRCDGKGGLSPRMVQYVKILINGALEQAVRNGLLESNVNKYTVLPGKSEKEISPMTEKEVSIFLECCQGERLEALYVLELFTGLRKGEISGLRWSDIDWGLGRMMIARSLEPISYNDEESAGPKLILTTPKTKSSKRWVALAPYVIQKLKEHRERQDYEKLAFKDIYSDQGMIFCREDGSFLHPRYLTDDFHRILKKAELPRHRFHDLRHTVASMLLNANENPKAIQELLGHSSISTTLDIYAHLSDSSKHETVNKIYDILQRSK